MASKPLPDQALLLKLLRYEPETGKLYWRERTPEMFKAGSRSAVHQCRVWNVNNANSEAFTALTGGYGHGTIFGKKFRAHRIVWMMVHGFDPEFIDHIDGDRRNNRIMNLRSVTRSENNANLSLRKDSPHGVPGIIRQSDRHAWTAKISKGKALINLGSFATKDEAIAARKDAERRLGFHINHGRRTSA